MPKVLFAILLFVLPRVSSAEITITEIAWMGTDVSANDEWIEIYNSGSESVNLSGWTIEASDGTPNISLSGTIGAGSYELLERTDDTSFPGITALVVFTGAIGNEGENLSLKNNGTTVQAISYSGGWPAGDVSTKKTMQWTGSSWITADESAGGPTIATDDEDPVEEEEEEPVEEEEEENTDTQVEQNNSEGGSKSRPKRTVYEDMIFELDFPSSAVVGVPAEFSAQALDFDRGRLRRGKYIFNMGDGTVRTFTKGWNGDLAGSFTHTYEHPGTYQISIQYFITAFEDVPPDVDDTFNIEVTSPNLTIPAIHPDGSIEIKNSSASSVNISGWTLTDANGRKFKLPLGSAILAGKSVIYSQKLTRLMSESGVTLTNPSGGFVATSLLPKTVLRSSSAPSKKIENINPEGAVLGASVALASQESSEVVETKNKDQNGLVFVLIFIILILVSIIAVLFLKKEEQKEGYVLIDE